MRLPEVDLDDRRFQDLVNEARLRIAQVCPEWTDHNVSDPGVTLIELFAWMTDMLVYRLNRVPVKLHVQLLELLGIKLGAPTAAATELRFKLSAPPEEPLRIPAVTTEVGTVRTAHEEAIVFQTTDDFTIPVARPVAYALRRGTATKEVAMAGGAARPRGDDQLPFGSPPSVGDALLLGFDESLARLLLRVEVDCSQARGTGVEPEDAPLRWEVATGEGPDDWDEAEVLEDTTGGFNYGSGTVELALPRRAAQAAVGGRRAYWLRCRVDELTRSGRAGARYTDPPSIYSISAAPTGALLPASHAARVNQDPLGDSDGTPGQRFRLSAAPVLRPEPGETLEVRPPGSTGWERWELRDDFGDSGPDSPHFTLDETTGTVELGPAVRAADGSWRLYGRVPPRGATLRLSRYRHGGGRHGNVAAGSLSVLKRAIPGVVSVTNPVAATGGVDAETLEDARQRAALELRARDRAVTAEDFEYLALQGSRRVGRAVCRAPEQGSAVRVHVLPRVRAPDRRLDFEELTPSEALFGEVGSHLERRKLLGTTVELLPVRLRGVTVVTSVEALPQTDLERVQDEVAQALYTYLNPLVGGSFSGPGPGWEFGRTLNQGELYGVVHAVDGVRFVRMLRMYEVDLRTDERQQQPAGSHIQLEPDELIASGPHIVKAELGDA